MSIDKIKMLIQKRIALDLGTINITVVTRAITRLMQECNLERAEEYYKLLNSSDAEMQKLIDSVVIGESWFLRKKESFDYLVEILKNRTLSDKKREKFRIISLGCSTGEEPYSIAISLLSAGFDRDRFEIDAVDVSNASLQTARKGLYREHSFRGCPPSFKQRYFSKREKKYLLKEEILQCVHFVKSNILDLPLEITETSYDVIFLRNVLIYFTDDARLEMVKSIRKLLKPNGMVVVDLCEVSHMRGDGFNNEKSGPAFVFNPQSEPILIERSDMVPEKNEEYTDSLSSPKRPTNRRRNGTIALTRKKGFSLAERVQITKPFNEMRVPPENDWCYLRVGIEGDHSCEELKEYIHCRNCPIYSQRARMLLDQVCEPEYQERWEKKLAQVEKNKKTVKKERHIIFRIQENLFAIAAVLVTDVSVRHNIHTIPRRSNRVLLGLANFSGELRLCVSLHEILGSERNAKADDSGEGGRIVTIHIDELTWAFPVDDILGIHELQNVSYSSSDLPVSDINVGRCVKENMVWNGQSVACLDPQRLSDYLRLIR